MANRFAGVVSEEVADPSVDLVHIYRRASS
jgi:hypothetical protein